MERGVLQHQSDHQLSRMLQQAAADYVTTSELLHHPTLTSLLQMLMLYHGDALSEIVRC